MFARIQKELEMLRSCPPPGTYAWPKSDGKMNVLEAQIKGPEGTPYENGIFSLEIELPNRYPFEPPQIRFITPIYHPNIDSSGRICLDTLKQQPNGTWSPSINLCSLLTMLRLLLSEPNAKDGLEPQICQEYLENRKIFNNTAKHWTEKYTLKSFRLLESKSDKYVETNNCLKIHNRRKFDGSNNYMNNNNQENIRFPKKQKV